jgi:hypothetical protein
MNFLMMRLMRWQGVEVVPLRNRCAWRDPAFKATLIANPAAALKAEGMDVPADMTVGVVKTCKGTFIRYRHSS